MLRRLTPRILRLLQGRGEYPIPDAPLVRRPPLNPFVAFQEAKHPHRARWRQQGQDWRTEPEIGQERRNVLAKRLAVPPQVYPFADMKLTRADVEWLLATHHAGCGPVNWDDDEDRWRDGLDLRGADLRGVDLRELPLARLSARSAHFEGAIFFGAHLERADFFGSWLQETKFSSSFLQQADFKGARLQGSSFTSAHLQGARFDYAVLTGAELVLADLTSTDLLDKTSFIEAHVEGARFQGASSQEADYGGAYLEGANFDGAHLEGAKFKGACLAGASFARAHLEGAYLWHADLAGKLLHAEDLARVRMWRPDFPERLPAADLRLASFDFATTLDDIVLGDPEHGFPRLADIHWGGANLAVVDWTPMGMLGDERTAHQFASECRARIAREKAGRVRALGALWGATRRGRVGRFHQLARAVRVRQEDKFGLMHLAQIDRYKEAVRANRQVAIELRAQGLNEYADRFAYRAQTIQRNVLWRERDWWRYGISWLGDLLAGYGYQLWKSGLWYGGTILVSAVLYYVLAPGSDLAPTRAQIVDALAESVTAFHGRGIAADQFRPGDPRSIVAAVEAMLGLVIEICLIVTFTQRFFGK